MLDCTEIVVWDPVELWQPHLFGSPLWTHMTSVVLWMWCPPWVSGIWNPWSSVWGCLGSILGCGLCGGNMSLRAALRFLKPPIIRTAHVRTHTHTLSSYVWKKDVISQLLLLSCLGSVIIDSNHLELQAQSNTPIAILMAFHYSYRKVTNTEVQEEGDWRDRPDHVCLGRNVEGFGILD